ncbi:NAD(P)/FAD-dependent oxidoreductase [Halomonas sp. LS-001]
MSTPYADLVIVGTGMAGIGLARALRRTGDTRSITLISSDRGDEYTKPLLSTGFAKKLAPDQLAQRDANALAEALNAEVLAGAHVTAIDPEAHQLQLTMGDNISSHYRYQTLVLATGAAPRIPFDVPDTCASRCVTINDLDDYRRFHATLGTTPSRIAIIGAGLVGCEFANDLHAGGHSVTLMAPENTLLPRLLPETLGAALADAFHTAGIELALGQRLQSITCADTQTVRLSLAPAMSDSKTVPGSIEADVVLLATGLVPRTKLAETAGLSVSASGITVDRTLQTTHPDIYALGDVACIEGVNAMYVQPLQASAQALANTLSGTPTSVSFGAWPVVVKTPLLPVVAYPPQATPAHWKIDADGHNITALAEDERGNLVGFALTGSCVRQKVALSRAAPALLG